MQLYSDGIPESSALVKITLLTQQCPGVVPSHLHLQQGAAIFVLVDMVHSWNLSGFLVAGVMLKFVECKYAETTFCFDVQQSFS